MSTPRANAPATHAPAIRVLLPPTAAHLAPLVLEAGATPVVDATGETVPEVPPGAWVRTRPGRPAPGTGPVVLAELGAAVPDRETWLETAVPREVPGGFAGLVLKGREAGGLCGEEDGLTALARCSDPKRVILDAGCGPRTAAAAAALGANGVLLVEPHLGCPEIALPPGLERRMHLADDEITRVVHGVRVCAAATAPVLRRLVQGIDDPWTLQSRVWRTGDPAEYLWLVGQGLALARGLAERYGTLTGLLRAYVEAWKGWPAVAGAARAVPSGRPVGTALALVSEGTAATTDGIVGSAVLWEEAAWLGRPVHGGPLRAAMATGCAVVADPAELADEQQDLPRVPSPSPSPSPSPIRPAAPEASVSAIAIVGIGCRFPGGSNSPDTYWQNIVGKRYAITEIPKDRWDPALFWDPDADAPDRTYSKIGGFLTDFVFDGKPFRIPPNVARQVDPVQQITLVCVADALRDAGLKVDRKGDGKDFDRERCAVILGNSLGGEVSDKYAIRLAWPDVARKLVATPPFCDLDERERLKFLEQMEAAYKAGLPVVDEDSMPGELANVIAGRIANAFDLGGANYTVDAACASSMAAIQAAVKSLQDGDSDLVLTGGADRSMNIATYVKFCKIGALSPDHSSPFDASANGFVMGEGCGILVLKRYEDAVHAGDRVYAVIRGIGASSDGKGKGITAPNLNGQVRALKRAYASAGIDPWDVDLVEAHGTSTVVGDKVEVEALGAVVGAGHRGDRGPVRIGSVKSMIGHLKSAAGAASVIKAALALHHGVLPPSLNFRNARPDVPFDVVPVRVQTDPEPWPETPDGLRRAGVSAFGFGGTNFHVVLESFAGQPLPASTKALPPAPQPKPVTAREAPRIETPAAPRPAPSTPGFPEGLWATSGRTMAELAANLKLLQDGRRAPFEPSAPLRIAAAPADAEERAEQLDRAIKAVEKGSNPELLRARGVSLEDVPFDRKLAFLFTGQGSQYLGMGLDLAEAYPVVRDTFAEADRILGPKLGKPITEYFTLRPGEDEEAKEDVLRQTEYSQPATLTIDVALLRLLASYGAVPDMVAGHSLGEYAACVAAGVMTFEQALHAVSARGREMASIRIDDPGKMAGIAASTKVVDEVLADVDGYVIAANKNCPTQTVIAGASDAVDEACERFKAKGITVYPLPVSHAFHSRIVAPASEPLKGFLKKLGLQPPRRPITTNVTGEYYPTGPNAVEPIIDLLAQQISAPVEWTAQLERMYEDDARVFVEVGPKRALSGFTVAVLKRRPHRALYTNHPKRGGVASFRDGLAQLLALGVPLRAEGLKTGEIDLFARPEPRRATTQAISAYTELHASEAAPDIREGVLRIVAKATGYEAGELDPDHELEADLGIDTVKQAEVFSVVRETYGIPADPAFSFAEHKTLRSVIDWAAARTGARRVGMESAPPVPVPGPAPAPIASADVVASFLKQAAAAGLQGLDASAFASALLPAVQGLLAAAFEAARQAQPPPAPAPAPAAAPVRAALERLPGSLFPFDPRARVVCSGTAIGLPGGDEVFGPDNFVSMLSGRNRISHIGARAERFLHLGLVRLVKDPETGQGSFLPVQKTDEVIRLAGVEARFDLREWGIDDDLVAALDVTTRLSFAAGLEALRDAGIPLVRTFRTTASGKKVPQGWHLPAALRDGTGVIFGAAFPGFDEFARHFKTGGRDVEGRFDRRFLFQTLSMGHSQFAQLIGARGPNTAVNAACASSTQALALAEDWIRTGRCERVIVVGADDVTSENLLPWIGGGFMAAGAASTNDKVDETALPFDRRRHGLVLGMGAVGVVVETAEACAKRGVVPLAEQLGTAIVNSAFHGTRLDVDHIATVMRTLVEDVCRHEGITPAEMARQAFFMSHETYTPARGGSAQAEIEALRAAFGEAAAEIVVTNTKGFTGHPMGAGIEDGVTLKALQYGVVPPVANLKEPDPQLGDLVLSRGERRPFKYGVRLAAGFGSQLAITIHKAVARGDDRLADARQRTAWLREVTGYDHVAEVIEDRTLRVIPADTDHLYDLHPDISPAQAGPVPVPVPVPVPDRAPAPAVPRREAPAYDTVLADLIAVVAARTGYEPSEIEPDFELEADLGVDTVKQAEILGELTEKYGLQRDEGFRVADYPTLSALAGYLLGRSGGAGTTSVNPAPERIALPELPAPSEPTEPAGSSLADLMALVAEKTGYAANELEPSFELEADLGIDTVKQAEILGEITERYGLERDESFRLSDHPTLEKLALYLDQRRGAASAVVPPALANPPTEAPTEPDDGEPPSREITPVAAISRVHRVKPAPPPPPPEDGPSYEETLAELLAVVADKTGYDVADLEPSFELEADLGVDTVKQAEILSAVTERYGLAREDGFRPSDYNTLDRLARYLHGRRTTAAVTELPFDPERTGEGKIPTSEVPWPPVPPPEEPKVLHHEERTAEVPEPAPEVETDRGFVAEEFDLSPALSDEERLVASHVPLPPNFRLRQPVLTARPLAERPASLAGRRVQVLGEGPVWAAIRQEIRARSGLLEAPFDVVIDAGEDVLQSFTRAKSLDGPRPQVWIAVTRLGGLRDGDFGVARGFADGSRAGFAKALGREWEGTVAKVLDVHPAFDPAEAARIVCDEVLVAPESTPAEVFVLDDYTRHVVKLEEEAAPAPLPITGNPVVLVTGGGRGITAAVCKELARRGKVRLALVGRGAAATEPLDEKLAKDQIKKRLQDAGDRVTPAKVEQALEPLRRADEVRRTLEELRALGAEVRYLEADLSTAAAARDVVKRTTEAFGPIGVLVHGAGVEESRLVADKDEAAFHRVFDAKAVGGRALLEAIPAEAYAVSMGSVAGRFGNPGQVDYAAANDALARMCHTRPHSLHVDWTAWDDVGMAVRGGMKALLTDRGVDLLPAVAGAHVLADLVAARITGELVCAGRLGDFETRPAHPLLDSLELVDGTARAVRALSKKSDPWILDHAIESVPVLPGVIGLELMAATAQALFPQLPFRGARNVRFNAPVKVHRDDTTTVMIEAEPAARAGEARTRLVSVRALKNGRVRRTEHFSATVLFGSGEAPEGLPSAFLPDEAVDQAGIYRRFFHGPAFQVLTGVMGVSADGLFAEAKVANGRVASDLLTLPLLLEAAFQGAGLHRMVVSNEIGLPLELEEVQLLSRPADGVPLAVMVQFDGEGYHVDIDGTAGPVLRLRGFSMVDKGPVPPQDRFPEPDEERPSCFPARPRRPRNGRSATAEAKASEDPSPWLTKGELEELSARGTDRRVRDRVAGRIAAKRALSLLTGLDPHRIRVGTAPSGEPVAEVPGHPTARVSLSHREGRAVAVAVLDGRVGVDLERVEARPTSFAETWFSQEERLLADGDPERETVVWAVKEAVLKWLGTGLKASPHDVRVVDIGPDSARVELRGELEGLHRSLGGSPLAIRWASAGIDEVVVTVRSAA